MGSGTGKGDTGAVEKVQVALIDDLPDRTQFAWGQSSKIELGYTVGDYSLAV
jgi:hypothetical protein